jgi:hypothetical protein
MFQGGNEMMNYIATWLPVVVAVLVLFGWLVSWRKMYQVDLSKRELPWLSKTLIRLGIVAPIWLPTVASADVGNAARSAGGQVFNILMIVLIVVGAICMLIGWVMHSTGGQRWKERGMSKILIAGASIAGGAFTMLLIKWVWGVATGAGGGNSWQLPF